ncbi:MAG TPA: MipA/OmpV family protein [Steroidobacteraceae bacterium]|nr:MipA/OmpV family protein [Steroidobacteraceae bacterium]
MTLRTLLLGSVALAFIAPAAHAEEKPLWEFGLGAGAIAFPDYRGADEGRVFPVPVPYFVYRGPILKADRDGLRGKLFNREYVELDLSVGATIPVNSEDNAARRGMPDLQPTLELGPSVEVHLWRSADRDTKLDLIMPLRVPITLESSPRSLQWTFAPRLNIDFENFGGHAGWNFGAGVGPVFAADKFHEYFYSVPAQFATAQRPEYRADGGYSGMHVLAAVSKRFPKYWFGAFLRYDWLGGAEFEDSPLMRRENSLAGGFGFAWMIRESKRKVREERL